MLVHEDLIPPDTLDGVEEQSERTLADRVRRSLYVARHGTRSLAVGVGSELRVIREAIEEHKPHVTFNLLEEFDGYPLFDQHVVGYL